ncbi:hypothetical protein [Variovorax terrae]|uniref:Uncharacterized protein n=1 Tax=Variovorax terrae TaxID=2923278 RepID=A0A9X2AQL5_9BURK|nr:hypothetical protein [Variovorax terrae]MCJ0766145.1 hypothetical protein [Variovorax terrae]
MFDFLMKRRLCAIAPPLSTPPDMAYRLRSWPPLNGSARTAGVLRTLTRMTLGPMSAQRFVTGSGLTQADGERLLKRLVDADYVEEIDIKAFRRT